MTRLYIIADDSMEGRRAGQNGNFKVTDYIAREFKRLGLKPAGDSGTYFQSIPYVQRIVSSWSRLVVNDATLELWTDYAPIAVNGVFPGVTFETERTEAVFGGRVGETTPIDPGKVAGKLVVLAPALGSNGQPSPAFNGAPGMDRFHGAVAVAIVSLDLYAPEFIASLKPTRNVPPSAPKPDGPMLLSITPRVADLMLGVPLASAKVGELGSSVHGRVIYEFQPTEAPARNVIGILTGSDPKLRGEYVAIGAHNDHIGIQRIAVDHDSLRAYNRVIRPEGAQTRPTPPTPEQWTQIQAILDSLRKIRPAQRLDSIANGADDDGSGTVVMLEIAENLARSAQKPKRSIIFVSHTGEEAGLLGSQHFTDNPTVPRDSIVAQLNMDMVGRGRAEDVKNGGPWSLQVIGSRRLSTQLGDIIDSVNTVRTAVRTQPMQIDYSFDAPGHPLNRYCRSDHYMYARYGIPISYFSLGYHQDYHIVTDEPQYIDYDHSARVGNFVKDVALAVANRPERIVVDKPKPNPKGGCRQ
ncbi:MAG: M20/M25/M40 family metallo-hydrolase [Gemmatimonadota bacterium]|nr:M20/M25/M40 family metallo-hydrolase [Gemmatimonadota bacterium]